MSVRNPSPKEMAGRRKHAEEVLRQRAAFVSPKTGERWSDLNCAEGCRGWDVFETDRGFGIETCDECNAIAKRHGLPTLTDMDVKQLPAARHLLQRHIKQYGATRPEAIDEDEIDNPRSVMTGPAWSSAREKLRGAATGARKNPHHDRIPGGLASGRRTSEGFNQHELIVGTRHELEHTDDPRVAREIAMDHLVEDPLYYTHLAACERKRNPEAPREAVDKYEEFHRYKPIKIGEFDRDFSIPKKLLVAGPAKYTTYRSAKVDPSTLKKPRRPVNYIHEHDAGVHIYLPPDQHELVDDSADEVEVPCEFRDIPALVKLGDSLGFCFEVEGYNVEAEGIDDPFPELYCTPDGKCLYVIQDKREVLAMIWGGGLGVFARGIDG